MIQIDPSQKVIADIDSSVAKLDAAPGIADLVGFVARTVVRTAYRLGFPPTYATSKGGDPSTPGIYVCWEVWGGFAYVAVCVNGELAVVAYTQGVTDDLKEQGHHKRYVHGNDECRTIDDAVEACRDFFFAHRIGQFRDIEK